MMWLATLSRPNTANAVHDVARYANVLSRKHRWSVKKILKYLIYTRTHGLTFEEGKGVDLIAHSASDYARDEEDRHSF